MDFERLLKLGYFPKELPPPFTTFSFGDFSASPHFPKIPQDYISRPCLHNLARVGNQRRVLGIPNPFNQFQITKLLSDNSNQINTLLSRSKWGLSKPFLDENEFRAYVTQTNGKDLPLKRAKIRAGLKFVVRADISRFYYSIYTHSIPWAILGKSYAKKHRRGGFANDLDLLLRNSQDGQTLGIPVGPDTSFIVSEIICSSIDEKLKNAGLNGFRFMDDFEFVFLTQSKADRALPIIEGVLQEFELALNSSKSFVNELPISFENNWRLQIRRFQFSEEVTSNELLEYFDLLFDLHNSNRSEPILRYGIARLKSINTDHKKLLVDLLFQCVLIESGTLKESLFVIEKLNIKTKKFKNIIKNLITIHAPMNHGSEVAWALWAAIFYNIQISDTTAKKQRGLEDSIIALLALHTCEKKLISKDVKTFWKHLMTKSSFEDGNWLLAYEADLKGWLPSIDKNNHVDSDLYFKVLKAEGISFYDDTVNYAVSKKESFDQYGESTEEEMEEDKTDLFGDDVDDLPF